MILLPATHWNAGARARARRIIDLKSTMATSTVAWLFDLHPSHHESQLYQHTGTGKSGQEFQTANVKVKQSAL